MNCNCTVIKNTWINFTTILYYCSRHSATQISARSMQTWHRAAPARPRLKFQKPKRARLRQIKINFFKFRNSSNFGEKKFVVQHRLAASDMLLYHYGSASTRSTLHSQAHRLTGLRTLNDERSNRTVQLFFVTCFIRNACAQYNQWWLRTFQKE